MNVGEDFKANAANKRNCVGVNTHYVLPVVDATTPEFAADLTSVWGIALENMMLNMLRAKGFGRKDLGAFLVFALKNKSY